MTAKKIQKAFNISTEKVKTFIDRRAEDLANANNFSTSYVIETAILDSFLPKDMEIKQIVFNNLYPDSGENGVKTILERLFAWNSDDKDMGAKQCNFWRLLKFCQSYALDYHILKENDFPFQRFLSQFGLLVEWIEKDSESWEDTPAMVKLRVDWARKLYDTACKHANELSVKYFLETIIDNWGLLYCCAITYRCLSYIVSKMNFEETAQARNELLEIIKQITIEWEFDY